MISVKTDEDMKALGARIGRNLKGGEIIELVGDVGAGKTTLVKGLGQSLMVDDDIQSPSFTLSRVYHARDSLELHHYDLYRLEHAGVLGHEFAESVSSPDVITVVEWAQTLQEVMPDERVSIHIRYTPDGDGRNVEVDTPKQFTYVLEGL